MVELDKADEPDATTNLSYTDPTQATISMAGIYAITASATGYASWTTTVYVEA
jgi:hypothetical protein